MIELLLRPVRDQASANAEKAIKMPFLKRGDVIRIDRIVAVDETSTVSKILVQIGIGRERILLESGLTVAANDPVIVRGPVYITDAHFIEAVFADATSGDKLALNVYGERIG